MTETAAGEPRRLDLKGSLAALKRAAQRAREVAVRTHTNLILVKDGKMMIVPPEELEEPKNP